MRSADFSIDAKLGRYCAALRQAKIEHAVIYWDRGDRSVDDGETRVIPYVAPNDYGSRVATTRHLLGLNAFAMRRIWKMRRKITLIHAIDFDTVIAARLLHGLTGIPYFYDIYDSYPDSRGIKGLLRKPFDALERSAIAHASRVILADPLREAQHSPIAPEKLIIIENVPAVRYDSIPNDLRRRERPLRIGYLGTLEPKHRGLENLLDFVVGCEEVELHIGGVGALAPVVSDYAERTANISYFGPLAHNTGLAMLGRCDILVGLYYASVANHRFAAPNKYFEHLLLGIPMLTSLGTPPGRKVLEQDTGWAISDSRIGIEAAVAEALANPHILSRKGHKAAELWHSTYAHYNAKAVHGGYIDAVRQSLAEAGNSGAAYYRNASPIGRV